MRKSDIRSRKGINVENVILTGATGFVGKWLIRALLEADINVTVIVRSKNRLDEDIINNSNFALA